MMDRIREAMRIAARRLIVSNRTKRRGIGLGLVAAMGVLAIWAVICAPAANAQTPAATGTADGKWSYYVDFRSRTAASYGHAFVWFGRQGQKKVEVAGLHPATDSVVPYMLGHIVPVPSETGASYGDLDEQYVTAKFRVLMNEPEGKRAFAYIKHLQATSPMWNAATFNCVWFISEIASNIGLRTPGPGAHLQYPEDWVNNLRLLNGGRQVVRLPSSQPTREAVAR
jgi:hypothetical protein